MLKQLKTFPLHPACPRQTPPTDVPVDEVAKITKAMPLVNVKWLRHCGVVCRMMLTVVNHPYVLLSC